jgi:hypothetical protein
MSADAVVGELHSSFKSHLTLIQLDLVHNGTYKDQAQFNDASDEDPDDDWPPLRTDFVQLRDVRRIEKAIEAEEIQLHTDDGLSTLSWIEQLRERGHLLGFKSKTNSPPLDSNLAGDVFSLMFQTGWQRRMFRKYGHRILCIDAMHNTTMYENLQLTTLVVRDNYAHGIPIAWMLASNGRQETILYFLKLNSMRSPQVDPNYIMMDFDWAQINACKLASVDWKQVDTQRTTFILLCWWHVLHAWQQHFHISLNLELWDLLKKWIRMDDKEEFEAAWAEIQQTAPLDFVSYLVGTWMKDEMKQMWSAVYRGSRNIFEMCDTNMLVEAYMIFLCLSVY